MWKIKRLTKDYTIVSLTEDLIKFYKSKDNMLSHTRFIKGKTNGFMLLDSKKSLIGYIAWENDFITAFEVTKDNRGKGFGSYILGRALQKGANKLSVNKNNKSAINLYTKLGWEVYEQRGQMLFMSYK